MNKSLHTLILLTIILVATVFRLFALGSNPPSLTWDEAAWGYNAYSLGIDGRDEFGRFLPIQYLESFGDFKPPVYAYLDILPIKVFGLNEFATRLPSAIAGVIAVWFTYLLVLRLFPKSKQREWYALVSCGLLAIAPWHILLSRAAFEANLAATFIIIAVWALLAGLQEKKWLLLISAISFVIPFYIFNTPRVFLPLFLIVLLLVMWKKLLKRGKQSLLAFFVGLILLVPLIPFLLSPQASLRFKEVNIFSDPQVVQTSNQEIANDHGSSISNFLHNRRFLYTRSFLQHYFDHLNPEYLFFAGDHNPKFSIQSVGEMYIWCLPFFYLGILFLFRKREGDWWILPLWFVLGIIPAATARETPHALRTEVILPTVQIFIAYGLVTFLVFIKEHIHKQRLLWLPFLFVICMFVFELLRFTHTYFVHYPSEYSQDWQYGYKESIAYVQAHQQKYDQVIVSDVLGRPYIYYLYYMQIPPSQFRADSTITRDAFGFVHVNRFGKYYFPGDGDIVQTKNKKDLFIAAPTQVPSNAHVLQTFYSVNNQPILVAYDLESKI